MPERAILHIDMNNFYASVECMLNPELKPYPIAVCESQEERHGIVLAKNYAAKAYGVSTGETVWQAKQKCKELVIVPPHYEQYMKFSKLAREIYGKFSDPEKVARAEALDKTIEDLRSRFGKKIIRNACLLDNKKMSAEDHPNIIMPAGVQM